MGHHVVRSGLRALSAIACTALIGIPAGAGVGTFRKEGNNRILDFCVSLRFAASGGQIAKVQQAFEAASPILADATDGRVRLGNVSILDDSACSSEAEIWVYAWSGSAVATYGLYGVRDEHIRLYYPSDFDRANYPVEAFAYTIAHELGHHLWNLRDEYDGPGACCYDTSDDPCPPNSDVCDCEPWPGADEATFCLMDNYYRRGGNNGSVWNIDPPSYGTFTLDEFCTQLNHDPDGDTYQDVVHGKSCWNTIGLHPLRRIPAPADLNYNPVPPIDAPPVVPAPTFVQLTEQNRFALVIDRSASMLAQDVGDDVSRLYRAKQAAHILLNQMQPTYDLGLVEFATSATPLLPLTPMSDENKVLAQGLVDDIEAGGATAIGLALIEARGMIAPEPDSCNQPIVLATDGFGNTGPSELTQIDELVAERIPVSTIAIGGTVNEANLAKLAGETGGRYWHVDSAEDLPVEFSFIHADWTDGGVLAAEPGLSEASIEFHSIDVDELTKEATFVLSWSNPNANLGLELMSPDGQVLTPAGAAADPALDFYPGTAQEILRVRDTATRPLHGSWRIRVLPEASPSTEYDLVATSDTPEYALTAAASAPLYDCGEPIVLHATPQYHGLPLRGVPVVADWRTPGGGSGTLALLDDGDVAFSGDPSADDGIYSARFLPPAGAGPGTYSFFLDAENTRGETAIGESLFGDQVPGPTVLVAPPFRRLARLHVAVACATATGDCDGDGVVGTTDHAKFTACYTGGQGTLQSDCECSDLTGDLLVDCLDWQVFEAQWGGSGPPPAFATCEGGAVPWNLAVGKVDPRVATLLLSWSPGCSPGARDYAIFEGQIGDWYGHAPVVCSTAGATTRVIDAPPLDAYYLVVPTNGDIEGSYGRDLADGIAHERPVAAERCAPAQEMDCP